MSNIPEMTKEGIDYLCEIRYFYKRKDFDPSKLSPVYFFEGSPDMENKQVRLRRPMTSQPIIISWEEFYRDYGFYMGKSLNKP